MKTYTLKYFHIEAAIIETDVAAAKAAFIKKFHLPKNTGMKEIKWINKPLKTN